MKFEDFIDGIEILKDRVKMYLDYKLTKDYIVVSFYAESIAFEVNILNEALFECEDAEEFVQTILENLQEEIDKKFFK